MTRQQALRRLAEAEAKIKELEALVSVTEHRVFEMECCMGTLEEFKDFGTE